MKFIRKKVGAGTAKKLITTVVGPGAKDYIKGKVDQLYKDILSHANRFIDKKQEELKKKADQFKEKYYKKLDSVSIEELVDTVIKIKKEGD